MSEDIILEMREITKTFSGVKALEEVFLSVCNGEIHALVGENGAGKSTLMNVLSGVFTYGNYTGEIFFNGELCKFKSIKQSEAKGIAIIHQELALSPYLSIAENIFLGNENSRYGIMNWNTTTRKTAHLLQEVGLDENPETIITNIGIGKQQLVEIAKALSKDVKLLILDEPTAALNETESENLLNLLLKLKNRGITSILISHKLNEVVKVADAITVLRDGKTIETLRAGVHSIDEDRIIRGMVGRELTDRFPERISEVGSTVFQVRNWTAYHPQHSARKIVDDVSIDIKAGEVVGIAGLMGAGRTEFAMSVFGRSYGRNISGQVFKDGKEIFVKTVADAIKNKIAYISEDRKKFGLVLINDISENITLTNLEKISSLFVLDENREILAAEKAVEMLKIKCTSILQKTGQLSGGNQQKVVLSKWIFSEADILIMDEPTRGIDVGAKNEVYKIINDLVAQGKSILLISSELPEILGVCDRIYVMSEGRIKGEMSRQEATQEKIMKLVI